MTRTTSSKAQQIARRAGCLLAVALLLFNICTMPAKAVGTGAVVTGVITGKVLLETASVLAAVCIGLGVTADLAQRGVFDNMVQTIKEALTLGDTMEVPVLTMDDITRYALPEAFISSVRSTLWSTKTVYKEVSGELAILPGTVINGVTINGSCYAFNYRQGNLSAKLMLCSTSPFTFIHADGTEGKGTSVVYSGGTGYYTTFDFRVDGYPTITGNNVPKTGANRFLSGEYEVTPTTEVVTIPGLIGNAIPDEEDDLITGYPGWYRNAVIIEGTGGGSDPGDESDELPYPVFPIGIKPSYEETVDQTPEEVVDPDPIDNTDPGGNAGTGTGGANYSGVLSKILGKLGEIVNAIVSAPGAVVDAVQNVYQSVVSIADFLTGTTVVDSPLEAINFDAMRDLFPFNIPAGIYDAINFWSKPAEAPVLSFPVPNMAGNKVVVDTYDIRLSDIPGFDRVVAVIRAGELICFAIGLALVTRKVTKW